MGTWGGGGGGGGKTPKSLKKKKKNFFLKEIKKKQGVCHTMAFAIYRIFKAKEELWKLK
jgi:hypothetical protein